MTTAMRTQQNTLEASTSHTSPLDTSDEQSHDYTSTNPNHYLAKKATRTTSWNDHSKSFQQFLQEDTTQLHFDTAAATQQQRNKKIEDTVTHYIMYSNFESYHHLLIDSGASTHVCPTLRARPTATTLWRISSTTIHQFHNSTRLPTRRFLSTALSMFPTSRTTSGS